MLSKLINEYIASRRHVVDDVHIGDLSLEFRNKIRFDLHNSVEEVLLKAEPFRYTLKPIKFPKLYALYIKQKKSFWTEDEITANKDSPVWERYVDDYEKFFICMILAFFASSDSIVKANLKEKFMNDVKIMEAEMIYTYQSMMENIHIEVYTLLLENFVQDNDTRELLFNAVEYVPCIRRKIRWCEKWLTSDLPYAYRVVAFIIVEGLFFSGSFCAIYWICSRYNLPELKKSNDFISRDENQHQTTGYEFYNMLEVKAEPEIVLEMMRDAVDTETSFIADILPKDLLGMNSRLMAEYIQYCADVILVDLGLEKHYNSQMNMLFMQNISIMNRTDFFTGVPSEYGKISLKDIEIEGADF